MGYFMDRSTPHTHEEVQDALGLKYPLWERLVQFVEDWDHVQSKWSFWGPQQSGWNLRYRRVGKALIALYPELIYRKYKHGVLVEEAILKIAMRCYYPDEFEALISLHGFQIINRWGGYAGEVYDQGPELIIEFKDGNLQNA